MLRMTHVREKRNPLFRRSFARPDVSPLIPIGLVKSGSPVSLRPHAHEGLAAAFGDELVVLVVGAVMKFDDTGARIAVFDDFARGKVLEIDPAALMPCRRLDRHRNLPDRTVKGPFTTIVNPSYTRKMSPVEPDRGASCW